MRLERIRNAIVALVGYNLSLDFLEVGRHSGGSAGPKGIKVGPPNGSHESKIRQDAPNRVTLGDIPKMAKVALEGADEVITRASMHKLRLQVSLIQILGLHSGIFFHRLLIIIEALH